MRGAKRVVLAFQNGAVRQQRHWQLRAGNAFTASEGRLKMWSRNSRC
jgi:hypothetical protein